MVLLGSGRSAGAASVSAARAGTPPHLLTFHCPTGPPATFHRPDGLLPLDWDPKLAPPITLGEFKWALGVVKPDGNTNTRPTYEQLQQWNENHGSQQQQQQQIGRAHV